MFAVLYMKFDYSFEDTHNFLHFHILHQLLYFQILEDIFLVFQEMVLKYDNRDLCKIRERSKINEKIIFKEEKNT